MTITTLLIVMGVYGVLFFGLLGLLVGLALQGRDPWVDGR